MKSQISRCQKMSRSPKDVKMSKTINYVICQKMSNVKKSNTLTMDEVHKKINLT